MTTNYEKYFGTPQKAAEQMNGCEAITAQFKWQRTIPEKEREGKTYLDLAIEWLQEECDQDLRAITPEALIEVVHLFDK